VRERHQRVARGLRVVHHDLRAEAAEPVGDVEARRVAHVVGAGLERRAPQRDPLAGQLAEHGLHEAHDLLAAGGVDLVEHSEQADGASAPTAGAGGEGAQPADVLGQAAAAVAEASGEERAPDAGVHAQRVGQRGYVRSGGGADVGHRVDERHLGGEERVGRALDQFRRHRVGHDQRYARIGERPVDLARGRLGHRAPHPGDDPVRAQRIGHRVPLAEELRVPRDLDRVDGGRGFAEVRGQPAGRARRDRGLADDECGTGQVRRERPRRAEHL
jgi:hypothetical protein